LIEEATVDVDGVRVFYRRIGGDGPPAVFVHGNPTHSEDWLPFLRRIEGPAVALDLPGWGRSERPDPRRFDGSMDGLASFFERFMNALEIGAHRLVVHDWGALALIPAQRDPGRVRRIVILNAVPLLPGYRWHWIARLWRRRWVGEAFNATTSRAATALLLHQARADRGPMPPEFVDMIWSRFDRGTRRAILALYRSAPEYALAAAGRNLGSLACPALVVWGARDPYLPVGFAGAYAGRLPNAELLELADAGHWPWVERPEIVERVVAFIDAV
jgi:pimeloyl-ACP methyl ester carboxylesterase